MDLLNRKGIKSEARAFIGTDRRWLSMLLACLPLYLLNGAISGGITVLKKVTLNGAVQETTTVSFGSSILSWLLIPFTVAIAGYYLNWLRGFNPEWKSIYREGVDRYGKYFSVGLITQIIIGLWTLLLIVPGIIKGYQYIFVHNIIHDNPNLSAKQARELSRRMTDGYKGDLFIMHLSFIPWLLLVGITFGIAAIYVVPYMACTGAMYYENLKNNAIATGRARPEEFGVFPVPPYADNGEFYNQNPQEPQNGGYQYNANPYAPQNPYAQNPQNYAPQNPFAAPNTDVPPAPTAYGNGTENQQESENAPTDAFNEDEN